MEDERKEEQQREERNNTQLEAKEEKNKELKGDNDVVSAFTDLPMGLLISQPFMEIAKGQAALCEVYLETIAKLAYDTTSKSKETKTRVLSFEYTKPVVDSESGAVTNKKYTINASLLSLVPVPAFFMEEATVSFSMDVNVSATDTSSQEQEASLELFSSFWGVKANISGKVSSNSSSSCQQSSSAKYDIYVRAAQKESAEGMAKLASMLASAIEPIETGK